jgi:hypothetical protein
MAAFVEELKERLALCDRHVFEGDGESGADVERFPTGLGMGADDGMKLALFAPVAALARSGAQPGARVNGAEAAEHGLHSVRESFVGEMLIREEGVAAIRRKFDGKESARHGGRRIEADIGMPNFGEASFLAVVGDLYDFGVARKGGDDRVDVELSPALTERDLLRGFECLVSEGQHMVLEEGGSDRVEFCGFEATEVHSMDFGTEAARKGTDFDGHRLSLRGLEADVSSRITEKMASEVDERLFIKRSSHSRSAPAVIPIDRARITHGTSFLLVVLHRLFRPF